MSLVKSMFNLKENSTRFKAALFIGGLVLGLVAGITVEHFNLLKQIAPPIITRINAQGGNYKYAAPLLAYNVDDVSFSEQTAGLQAQINSIIDSYKKAGKVSDVSVYYRGPNSAWIGINDAEEYNPASLFKVPIMIAYFKQSETDPTVLTRQITFNNPSDQSAPQLIPPKDHVVFGQTYTVEQLIEYMIIDSDNSAANMLADDIYLNQKNSYTEMLNELGLPSDASQISAQEYSLFLRILRNATYLNPDMSEKALSLMVQSNFKDGLSAGVPSNVQIAQKFGEYGGVENGNQIEELHDCGMVYAQKNYLICIMTKGTNITDLESLIKDISSTAYTEAEK